MVRYHIATGDGKAYYGVNYESYREAKAVLEFSQKRDPQAHIVEEEYHFTNADRIRAMSDEELADFFFESPEIEFTVCEYCEYFGGHTSDTPCKHDMGRCFVSAKNEAFKKWLQQPAEGVS